MIKVGDRIEWEADAHVHTKQMDIPNTGRIEGILPKDFKHANARIEQCTIEEASVIFVQADDSTARIGLCADYPDLVFPDAEEVWEESDEEDGADLLNELWDPLVGELWED